MVTDTVRQTDDCIIHHCFLDSKYFFLAAPIRIAHFWIFDCNWKSLSTSTLRIYLRRFKSPKRPASHTPLVVSVWLAFWTMKVWSNHALALLLSAHVVSATQYSPVSNNNYQVVVNPKSQSNFKKLDSSPKRTSGPKDRDFKDLKDVKELAKHARIRPSHYLIECD